MAVADLESIRDFIGRDSPYYGQLVLQQIVAAVDQVSTFPLSGRVVPELESQEYRELIVGSYRIVYRLRRESAEIVTVFRGARLFALPNE